MRLWITKGGELTIREQLVRQFSLAILSEDLPAEHRLPSVRALARRHRIHPNTVSAAYQELLDRGWVELRRGSGVYVRPLRPAAEGYDDLQGLLKAFLQTAHRHGYEPTEVLHQLEHLVRPVSYKRILIAEPEPALSEILRAELQSELSVPVELLDSTQPEPEQSLIVGLRKGGAEAKNRVRLRLRSVQASLEGQVRPQPGSLIAIVSESAEIRIWARAMLISVGLDPESLYEIDSTLEGWQERLSLHPLVITDVVSARKLPSGFAARVFRVISDSSLDELRSFCNVTPGIASHSAE